MKSESSKHTLILSPCLDDIVVLEGKINIQKKNYQKYFLKYNSLKYKYNHKREFYMKRDRNEQRKQKNNIFENQIIENLKKYYNIDDHIDLLKYIKNQGMNSH